MKRFRWVILLLVAMFLMGVFAGPVLAQKPTWAEGDGKEKSHQMETKSKYRGDKDYDGGNDRRDYRGDRYRERGHEGVKSPFDSC